ncbi:MAG: HNH endonuclease [Elusimicrobia bacterium]|nr:HNH endonuclease [Elusimicrobiota bacterium]
MTADVLVLNRSYFAISVTSWQRALVLLFADRAAALDDEYRSYNFRDWLDLSSAIAESPSGFVHAPAFRIAVPEVIVLKAFDRVPKREVPFTRRNIYHHYGYRCCYCGKRFKSEELNLDHVIPKSRGGKGEWLNTVTSCIPCNLRKGDRLPEEAGMRLVVPPTRPAPDFGAVFILRSPIAIRRSWQKFIDSVYWNIPLEDE